MDKFYETDCVESNKLWMYFISICIVTSALLVENTGVFGENNYQ
jgi:hypothetical protein